ncbi:response regulator [Ferruginibacter yonginensis]|uniref:Oxygen sensor histidine kinase NreB n=1 Tax=Ferruginibacter yonginensis TaxID=1310416 RepID=A0ABV8QTT6_9BACT
MIKDNNTYNILIIEDNLGDFILIEEFIYDRIESPSITHTKSFASTKLLNQTAQQKFDVILLDLSLPDKSGEELITEMNTLNWGCPIIVLTGYTDIEFSIKSLSLGAADYLLKDEINASALYKSIVYSIERRKANIQIAESEKRFSNLFQLSPQPMWLYDIETLKFIQVNKAAIDLYGYTFNEFLKMTILDLRPATENFKPNQPLSNQVINNDKVFNDKIKHLKKNKEIIDVEVYSSAIIINNNEYRLTIAIDVTEKILYENKMTKAIIKTQEDERNEIGGELHDNICQLLVASQMSLGMLKNAIDAHSEKYYEQCKEYISESLQEIRNLSHRLSPAINEDINIEDSFRKLLNNFDIEGKYFIVFKFDKQLNDYQVNKDIHINLYRILQEHLNNIIKYANCKSVQVNLQVNHHNIVLQIIDDGVGFEISKANSGIGFANMRRRAELFGGNFNLYSAKGKGCKLNVTIPIQIKDSIEQV